MRAKTILDMLFLVSLGVAAMLVLRIQPLDEEPTARDEILVATMPLAAGTLLRAPDVTWQAIGRPAERGVIVRPFTAVREAQPKADEEARSEVYGAALREAVSPGDSIYRGGIVKPGDRGFLKIVLSPGARAIAIPTGGASTGLLFPGDRVDVILTQNFNDSAAPLTRRSVSETVVENLRVLVIDAMDAKAAAGNTFGRTVTLEVMPWQAEKINVATELGKLWLLLRLGGTGDAPATSRPVLRPGFIDCVWSCPEPPGSPDPEPSSIKPTCAGAVCRL